MMRVYRYLEHLILNLVTPFACTRSSKARRADGRVRRSSIKWRQHEVPGLANLNAASLDYSAQGGRSVPCGQAGQAGQRPPTVRPGSRRTLKILTDLASFLRAVWRKSRSSAICLGILTED